MSRRLPRAAEQARARYLATDAQKAYLRRLLNEAFAHRFTHGLRIDPHHLEGLPKTEASAAISMLLAARARNWSEA